ncbi:MAG: RidA family protein [Myxococcaceae bacterium]|nr:RidA family protein [Myxococcaceae bacterium]
MGAARAVRRRRPSAARARRLHGALVGKGDLAAQAEQALLNVAAGLKAAGGSLADVAKLTVYVVKLTPEMIPAMAEGLGRAAAKLQVDPRRPTTLIGVHALSHPDLLIELDVTAVL